MDVGVREVAAEAGVGHEVGVACRVALLDDSGDRRPPLVVAPRVEEALVDSASDEVLLVVAVLLLREIANVEHIRQRVLVVFQPELVAPLNVPARSIRIGEGL